MVLFRANNENFLFTTIVCCVLLLALINCEKEVNGLNCYYKSKELMPDKSSEHKQNDSEPAALKQYECGLGDKYCVSLEGTLKALSRNYTFALKSCESDIQKYLTPISEKMGKDLEYKCSSGVCTICLFESESVI